MTLLIFFTVLSVLVLAHEWGHFIIAKRAGATVEEFGFGFPPKLFSFKKNGTVFSLNLIPFGGFVRIFGEDGEYRNNEAGSFTSLKISRRAQVIAAGVAMNLILACFLLILVNLVGRPEVIDDTNAHLAKNAGIQIINVAKNSPAESAGIKSGDIILSAGLDGSTIKFDTVSDFKDFIDSAQDKNIELNLQRGNVPATVEVKPRVNPPVNEGAIGLALAKVGLIRSPWYLAPWHGLKDTVSLVATMGYALFILLKVLISESRLAGEIAGPVGIATIAGQAYYMGLSYLLNLVAVLSINLAILNILPFPALDGGRLIFLLVEKIKGSPVSHRFEQTVNMVGFGLLLALMFLVTWKDIVRLF